MQSPHLFFRAPAAGLLALLSIQQGCALGHSRSAASKPTTASPEASTPAPESQGLRAGKVVSMGPTGLALPIFLRPLSDDARRFSVAAARALRMVYEEDNDDPSPLLALVHRLAASPDAASTKDSDTWVQAWQPVLQAGLERAQLLQSCARGLRALREAYADVYLEDGTSALRRLHGPSCRTAAQALQEVARTESNLMLTVEPMGPRPLKELLAPCKI